MVNIDLSIALAKASYM